MIETSAMITGTDLDTFVDNRPMNDEELSRLHESTLQMFRSNKIGPKNAFDIVLIDYLPAIFETTTFEDDRVNHFQSVGTTLETSAKIYAARIDSLYSETRKAQSILRSTSENFNRLFDEPTANDEQTTNEERRVSNNKKIRLMMKRKKTIVNDRQKLLRKNRNEEIRPIMMNQFFLSAMHDDGVLLSELYEKIKQSRSEMNENSSTSVRSNESICETLFVDTTLGSISSTDHDVSPSSSDVSNLNRTSLSFTPNSQISSSLLTQTESSIRSRANSLTNDTTILSNAVHLLTDTVDEFAHLDSNKVNAFINEKPIGEPIKSRKRRLSIEYPFPFLVEQAKKQRLTPKKLRPENLDEEKKSFERARSPEYELPNDEIINVNLSDSISSTNSNNANKKQGTIDFRILQKEIQKNLSEKIENDRETSFSDLLSEMRIDEDQNNFSSNNIAIYFAALLNNAVRHQLSVQNNDDRDDLSISSPKKRQ